MRFKISEFNTGNVDLPDSIIIKILNNFIAPLEDIRSSFGKAIYIRSGYRDVIYNKSIGGAKYSQHLYKGMGAADVSPTPSGVKPSKSDMDKLQAILLSVGNFRRIARYRTFFHIDYRQPKDDTYQAFYKVVNGKWKLQLRDGENVN